MGKSRGAHQSWEKRQLTPCPAMSCRKAGESTITFIYSWSQWVKFNLRKDLRCDLCDRAWSDCHPLRHFWMDTLQAVNAWRPHGISLPVTTGVGGAFGINSAFFLWLSTQEGLKCPDPVAVVLLSNASDGEWEAEPCQSVCWVFSHQFFPAPWRCICPDPSWRWGAGSYLAEEENSPIFLRDPTILIVHPRDGKTASSWCRKKR